MKRIVKSFYLLIVALIVFLGGLLIWQGMTQPREAPASIETANQEERMGFPPVFFYFQEGKAL